MDTGLSICEICNMSKEEKKGTNSIAVEWMKHDILLGV